MKTPRVLAILAVLGIAGLVTFADLPGGTRLWAEIQNACHAPAFGFLAIACLVLLRSRVNPPSSPYLPYFLSLVISTGLGAFTELVQHFAGRDAEVADLLRDVLGALAFLLLALTRDPALTQLPDSALSRSKVWLRFSAMGLLIAAFIPLGLCVSSYVSRDMAFPVVTDLTSTWSRQFIELENAELSLSPAPAGWRQTGNDFAAQITLAPSEYPGITVEEPYPDWTTYTKLRFELYSPDPDSVVLGLRIDDSRHDYSDDDRFTERLVIHPGANSIFIDLTDVRTAPAGRETDMRAIRRIILFAHEPKAPIQLFVSRIWLE